MDAELDHPERIGILESGYGIDQNVQCPRSVLALDQHAGEGNDDLQLLGVCFVEFPEHGESLVRLSLTGTNECIEQRALRVRRLERNCLVQILPGLVEFTAHQEKLGESAKRSGTLVIDFGRLGQRSIHLLEFCLGLVGVGEEQIGASVPVVDLECITDLYLGLFQLLLGNQFLGTVEVLAHFFLGALAPCEGKHARQ